MAVSSFDVPVIKHDVFISFRGEDIRTSFLSHLRKELRCNQIDFFVDDEKLHPGDEISSTLVRAIEQSSISLVIFSKHYASSRWCMEELVKIIECMKQYQRIVKPVFYNIDPSEVRHQKRTFAEAFDLHREKYEEENMQNWRSALKETANLSGIHYPSKYRVHDIYKVQELSFESSLELFCLKAFHKSYPENGYEELSEMAVNYAKGIPLALKVLGSFLCSRSIVTWESALRKLKIHPDQSIFNVLKLSFDDLDYLEKNIFMDIAFFFKGKNKDDVTRFLDSCDFFGGIGIDNLQHKALITISPTNTIEMHDLRKRSRLRNPKDVRNVLENSEGEKLVEGIICDLSKIGDICLNADTFKNMLHLRFLKFYAPWDRRQSNVYVDKILEPFSSKLRYLQWNSYPLNSLPSRFCAEKLVVFRMQDSQISKLWDGMQDLANLTVLDLFRCKKLVELPDLSKATKLKRLNLCGCEKLCQIHPSTLSIQTLEELYLNGCKELKSVKGNFKSLRTLHAYICLSLEDFSVSSEKLWKLCFSESIKSLSNEFCSLISLGHLCLSDCRELIELPHNIKALSKLRILDVSGCCGLRSIPELPPSIQVFDATECTSLETIYSLKAVFSFNRTWISFENCMRLEEESLNDITGDGDLTILRSFLLWLADPYQLMNSRYVYMPGSVCYPGYKVPRWFRCQTPEASITIELDQCNSQLWGFFFCCVVSQNLPPLYFDKWGFVNIKCEYHHFGEWRWCNAHIWQNRATLCS